MVRRFFLYMMHIYTTYNVLSDHSLLAEIHCVREVLSETDSVD
jgi:hypothetical protein